MIQRMIRAAKLDASLYEEVEHDSRYTGEAALIVIIVSLLNAIGGLFVADDGESRVGVFIGLLLVGLLGWLLWAVITDFVGRSFFGATSDVGEMLRVIGYSQSVLVLSIIPFVGFLAAIWALVCLVIALRQGLDISTGKAIAVGIIGWLVILIASAVVYAVFV
jgi:hypothetical protein